MVQITTSPPHTTESVTRDCESFTSCFHAKIIPVSCSFREADKKVHFLRDFSLKSQFCKRSSKDESDKYSPLTREVGRFQIKVP